MFKKKILQTYFLKLEFEFFKIKKVTIIDYYREKCNKIINNQLILELLKKLDGKKIKSSNYPYEINYKDKNYHLTFRFKKKQTDHLWIRSLSKN